MPLLLRYRNTLEALAEAGVLITNFIGQAFAELLEEIPGIGMFFGPLRGINPKPLFHGRAGAIQAVESEGARRGHQADWWFRCRRSSPRSPHDPLPDANIFTVARPEEFPVDSLAEPVHVEDF